MGKNKMNGSSDQGQVRWKSIDVGLLLSSLAALLFFYLYVLYAPEPKPGVHTFGIRVGRDLCVMMGIIGATAAIVAKPQISTKDGGEPLIWIVARVLVSVVSWALIYAGVEFIHV